MDVDAYAPDVQGLLGEYRQALPQQMEINAIVKAMAGHSVAEIQALDIGFPNPAMSLLLRQRGGTWSTVARDAATARQAGQILGGEIPVLRPDGVLPFEERTFDWIVVALGVLTSMADAEHFIHECHRVLRPTGQLILSTQRLKSFSIVNWVRRVSGETAEQRGNLRMGYTERDLFRLIKTGFDVLAIHPYARLWVELVRIWELRARRRGGDPRRVARAAGMLYRLAHAFDFLGRGHILLAYCRRRQWRPRTLPVLKDGRSIHEAVLRRTGR